MQLGIAALPPVAQRLLPAEEIIVLLCVQRLGKRTVNMKRTMTLVSQQRIQTACRDLRRRARQIEGAREVGCEEARLFDRLIGTAVDQLWRAISADDGQLFSDQLRFHHRRMQIRHRRAGGDNNRPRLAGCFRHSQRQKAQPALVKMSVANKLSFAAPAVPSENRAQCRCGGCRNALASPAAPAPSGD